MVSGTNAHSGDEDTPVAFYQYGPVAEIRLRRPDKRNAVTPEMAVLLEGALTRLESLPEVRVGIISSEGPVFCAGADLNYVSVGQGHLLSTKNGGFAGVTRYPRTKPLIAAVQGFALGGGFEIVLACDLIVADGSAQFGLPEVARGIIANGGGVLRLSSLLPSALALDLILTGRMINAREAAAFGIISRIAVDGTAGVEARSLAEEIAKLSPEAVQGSLRVARATGYTIPDSHWDLCSAVAARVRTSEEAIVGSRAFVEHKEVALQSEGENDGE